MPFFNTTNEEGRNLAEYQARTRTQDQKIGRFFITRPDQLYTPWEVWSLVFTIPYPPITSVRRSINTLTKAGILEKTKILKEVGFYGRRSYAWTLSPDWEESQVGVVNSSIPDDAPPIF